MSVRSNELESYVKRLGEHINTIYTRLNELNAKIEEVDSKIAEVRAELKNNANIVTELKEVTVQKVEFDEFVNRLTESLRELIPPVATESEETKKEEQQP